MVQGRIGVEHHPPEVGRELSRRDVVARADLVEVDGRTVARLVVAVDRIRDGSLDVAGFRRVDRASRSSPRRTAAATVVVDVRDLALYVDDPSHGIEVTTDHDGERFVEVALDDGVVVELVTGVDVRRLREPALTEAAATGRMASATVTAYRVDSVG